MEAYAELAESKISISPLQQRFREARDLVLRRQLDFSDAFQILSVKIGYFSRAVDDSRTLLVTADNPLAVAARAEGLRVWNVLTEATPP